MASAFEKLGIRSNPTFLAPLAGITDVPFRRVCQSLGVDLTYVELITAAALIHDSETTLKMLRRHESEAKLGVQLTGRNADEIARAIEMLEPYSFETVDINMGCPVPKVTKGGSGAALMKVVSEAARVVAMARRATVKPLSVKMRLGWDRSSLTAVEIALACEAEGIDWITVHGRTRSEDYGYAVDLAGIARVKDSVRIPVLGNGNIFCVADRDHMVSRTRCDGVMVARGVLGNPWIFRSMAGGSADVTVDEWTRTVVDHVDYARESEGERVEAAVTIRKHLLWYVSGWPGARKVRQSMVAVKSYQEARDIVLRFGDELRAAGRTTREAIAQDRSGRFRE